jgi:hypothetical protein
VLALPEPQRARPALAGLPAFWLGLGALRVARAAEGTRDLAATIGGTPPPLHFLEATAALLLIGLGSAMVTGVMLLTGEDRAVRTRGTAALAIVAASSAGMLLMPLWRGVHWLETAAVAAGIIAFALGTWRLAGALRLRAALIRVDRWLGAGSWPIGSAVGRGRDVLIGGLAASAGLALIPNTLALLAGTLLAAVFLHFWYRRQGLLPVIPALIMTTLGLVPLGWLLLTVAGSIVPSLASLPDAPLSPAAGLWMTPWLLLAAWGLLGQWPLQSLVPPPLLALLAGLLLVRFGIAAIPDGLLGYQAIIAPLVLISLWWAVATARLAMGLSALALFGAIAVPERGAVWLLVVFGAASLVVVAERMSTTHSPSLRKGLGLVAVAGLWPVLEAGLHTQVVYTVLAVAALCAAGAWPRSVTPYRA